MTEELARIIRQATCKKCNGEGVLAWRMANSRFAGEPITHTWNTIPCDECGGDGIDPDFRFT